MSGTQTQASEYAQFRQTFFAESAEMLADMDARLAALETDAIDRDELDAVFRCVHTIKAGAGMFNYARLVDFAHGFEALLDRMRDGRMTIDVAVAKLIIRAADILAELVGAAQSDQAPQVGLEDEVAHNLKALLSEEGPAIAATPAAAPSPVADLRTIEIGFRPHAEMLRHANEPLLIIRELKKLGALTVECDTSRVPELNAIEVEDAYFAWTFTLITDANDAAIRDVFEFVEDYAEIAISVVPSGEPEDDGFGLWLDTPTATSVDAFAPVVEPPVVATKAGASGTAGTSIRVDLDRVDRLVNMVGELVISQAMLRQELSDLTQRPIEGLEALDSLTRDLQDCVMAIRMQPVRSVFTRMPRLVRDVAGKLGKSVRLTTAGEQTELDKTVIEELSDPLTHMIRNSIDHGIEMPEVRLAAGKPAEGRVTLSAAHVGSNILIHLEDDGAGLNRERLYKKAVEKGVIADGAKLSDDEIVDLIFAPGFSTAASVTDVSGRGVGMDVVRRNIMKIGGRIQVASTEGKGTRFTLVIPLTLAVLDGMVVSVGDERYILPLTSIIESFRPTREQLRTLAEGGRLANVRGGYIRLIGLNRIFGVSGAIDDPTAGLIVLVETATGARIGLIVDELLGQQQVVIKSLHDNYTPIAGISGGTILGDGQVALILDIEQLSELEEACA